MIKKFLTIALCALICVSVVPSCGENAPVDDGKQEQPENPDDPTPDNPTPDNPTPEEPTPDNPTPDNPTPDNPTPDTPTQTPVDIYPGIPTPVVAYQDKVEATKEGVSIEVTKKENHNFVFVVRPGEMVQSYRLDVFPLCRLYNALYEQMKSEGKTSATERDIDTWIRSFVFNSTGSGAYTFDAETTENYAEKEFDWMNTPYAQAHVVPDAEYAIVAVACYDKEGTDDGEMSICYVKTPAESLVGDPRVEVDVKVSYTEMEIHYIPNPDCKYIYQWCSNEDDLMPYINTYGEKLYIDFMRHTVGDAIAATDLEALSFYINFGQSASSEVPIMATAIGLDKNQTPAKQMDSKVFNLLEKPYFAPAEGSIKIDNEKLGASYFWYEYTMGGNCPYMFFKVITPAEAEYYKTKATAEELEAFARSLNDEGWGLKNYNYSYDETTGQFGDSMTEKDVWLNGNPNTEYVIAYVCRNRVQELGDVQFTDVFKTKPLVLDNPAACQSDCNIAVTTAGRTSIKVDVTYSFEKCAGVRFAFIGTGMDGVPGAGGDRETYLNYLGFGMSDDTQGMAANNWWAEPRGKDGATVAGLDPGTKYIIAYASEDWNGVVGEVKFAEASTQAIVGGDNPAATITAAVGEDGNLVFTFTANNDTEQMYYMVGGQDMDNDALGIKYLGNENYYTAEEMLVKWRTYCSAQGLPTYNLTTTLSQPDYNQTLIALCVPYGANSVRGELAYLIWDGTAVKTLADYYPNYKPASAKPVSMPVVPQRKSNLVPAKQYKELITTQSSVAVKDVITEYRFVDMHRLGAHPKASMR